MKSKVGILGALSVIAVGVSVGSMATSPAMAQQVANVNVLDTSQMDPELLRLCGPILQTKTVREFKQMTLAWTAYNDVNDKCHEIAQAQYALLIDNEATGAIDPNDGEGANGGGGGGAGYNFG